MAIEMRLSTSLRRQVPDYNPLSGLSLELTPGETVAQVLSRLEIDPAKVKLCMLNGVSAPLDSVLTDGDRVALFPPVGGG